MVLHRVGQYFTLNVFKISALIRRFSHPIDIFKQIKNATHVLICLPHEHEDKNLIMSSLHHFTHIFPKAKITIFYNRDDHQQKQSLNNFRVIDYSKQDLTGVGLPNGQLKRKIFRHKFNIVVDLSISFNFINTAITQVSKADLRICFYHEKREDLYNFVIRHETKRTLAELFNLLLKHLGASHPTELAKLI